MALIAGQEAAAYSKAVAKMSSGKRIFKPKMDAGGHSMEVRLASAGERHKLAMQNMLGAISRTQTQISLLQQGMKMLERMEELSVMALGPALSDGDRENYNKEFQELLTQYQNLFREKYLGNSLFGVSEECGSQSIRVANSQDGEAAENIFEIDTVTGSGWVNFDQFAEFIPDLFQVYHGDTLIHERVTGASFFPAYVGGLHTGNSAHVAEYFGNDYKPEPFQDFGEDGLPGTGDEGEGNGTYDLGEPFTDEPSGTRDGVPILNGSYDGYGPYEAAYLNGEAWTATEAANPSPGDQPGARSVFRFGPQGLDLNGNPYETNSTKLRFVVNQGGATQSDTDLTPNATLWEYEIEIFPESPDIPPFTVMTDGHGNEITLQSVDMAMMYSADVLTQENAQSSLSLLSMVKECAMEAISQASANMQRLTYEIEENENRIVTNEDAVSKIADLDMAAESTRMAIAKIRYESATRILKDAQIIPQALLSLLQ